MGEKFCTHCNREGHNEESCYQLIGFPDWWDEKKRGGRGPGRGGKSSGARGGRGRRGVTSIARANVVTTTAECCDAYSNRSSHAGHCGGVRESSASDNRNP